MFGLSKLHAQDPLIEKLVLDAPFSGYVQKGNALTRRRFPVHKGVELWSGLGDCVLGSEFITK